MRCAVIGAGLSGLIAANELRQAGCAVRIFDKGRRPGGRANTREHGERRFDHGAQFFTARSPRIHARLHAWLRAGVVAEWRAQLVHIEGDRLEPAHEAARYVGVPGMRALAAHLAAPLEVEAGVRVGALERAGGAWRVLDDEGALRGEFDRVLVAAPAAQAAALLRPAPELAAAAASTEMAPCWALMVTFAAPLTLPFDGAFVRGAPFSWIALDASKPGRPPAPAWVVHGAPDWSRAHLELDPDEAAARLLEALRDRFGPLPDASFAHAHRWRYALPEGEAPGVLYDPGLGLGACGDWTRGGRVEGALLSGLELAERVLADRGGAR